MDNFYPQPVDNLSPTVDNSYPHIHNTYPQTVDNFFVNPFDIIRHNSTRTPYLRQNSTGRVSKALLVPNHYIKTLVSFVSPKPPK